MISFRPMRESDFELMHTWLCRPHVAEWWEPTPTMEDFRADYLQSIVDASVLPLDAPSGTIPYFAYRDGRPFGYVQAYRVMAHQKDGWWLQETDPTALGIDQFIGEAEMLNKGIGTEMVRSFVAQLLADPRVTKVQTDPDPKNGRAIACYRKAGFRDVGPVVTLDGPALLMVVEREG